MKSKEEGTSVGIRSISLGPETVVTAVEDIIFEDGQTVVILKHFDSSGYILPSHRINLEDFQAIHSFSTPFINPYIQNIGREKNWFF
jgi:hypothetical protein